MAALEGQKCPVPSDSMDTSQRGTDAACKVFCEPVCTEMIRESSKERGVPHTELTAEMNLSNSGSNCRKQLAASTGSRGTERGWGRQNLEAGRDKPWCKWDSSS